MSEGRVQRQLSSPDGVRELLVRPVQGGRAAWDMCCGASVASMGAVIGCQLWTGHVGEHAALVLVGRQQVLRRWAVDGPVWDVEWGATVPLQLPWSPGRPIVAGDDGEPSAEVSRSVDAATQLLGVGGSR